MATKPRDWNVIHSEIENSLAAQKQADKDAQNKIFDTNKKTITDNYTQSIKDGEAEYEDDYRENAVQKKVNEFYISEEMANMGLANSGFNRTQITANQLSYANNKAEIDRKRQSMVDSLKIEMTNKLTENENERTGALAGIDSSYKQTAIEKTNEIYGDEWDAYNKEREAEIKAETERQKAYYSALEKQAEAAKNAKPQNIINSKEGFLNREAMKEGGFTANNIKVKENGNGTVTYFDIDTGYSSTFAKNENPFTGRAHKNAQYGTFDNGYQPNNMGKDESGKILKLRAAKRVDTGETATLPKNGQQQTVWTVDGKTFYLWNGAINDYEKLNPNKAKGVFK